MVFARYSKNHIPNGASIYPRLCFQLLFVDPTFVKERCVVRPVHLIFPYISSLWTLSLTRFSSFSIHFPLATMSSTAVRAAVPNGIPRPDLDLPVGHCSRFLVNIRILRCHFSTPTSQRLSRTICSSLQSLRQTRAYI